jgi:hypothetical protein
MIAILLLIIFVVLLALTPWRRLQPMAQLWVLACCFNTLVFFSMPTTPATSAWRPIIGRFLGASAAVSFALLVLGVVLHRRYGAGPGVRPRLLAPLLIGALPSVFYAFFWLVGPLH